MQSGLIGMLLVESELRVLRERSQDRQILPQGLSKSSRLQLDFCLT